MKMHVTVNKYVKKHMMYINSRSRGPNTNLHAPKRVDMSSFLGLEGPLKSGNLCELKINPHQRCGYSDSPFARKDTFLYCRVQKLVGGVDSGVQIYQNGHDSTNMHLKNQFYAGNSISGRREAFGTGPDPQNDPKT